MRIISLHSYKGGTGKTSIAIWLAYVLAEEGKTLLVDLDFAAPSIKLMLGLGSGRAISTPTNWFTYLTQELGQEEPDQVSALSDKEGLLDMKELDEKLSIMSLPLDICLIDKATMLAENERVFGNGSRKIEAILQSADREGYQAVIIDHHPGPMFLSKSMMELAGQREWGCQKNLRLLFTSTLSRADAAIQFLNLGTSIHRYEVDSSQVLPIVTMVNESIFSDQGIELERDESGCRYLKPDQLSKILQGTVTIDKSELEKRLEWLNHYQKVPVTPYLENWASQCAFGPFNILQSLKEIRAEYRRLKKDSESQSLEKNEWGKICTFTRSVMNLLYASE